MPVKSVEYRLRRALPKIFAWLMTGVLLVIIVSGVLLAVNGFSLTVVPIGGDMRLECGEAYREPGVEVRLAGKLFFKDGIPVDAEITTDGGPGTEPGVYTVRYSGEFFRWEFEGERTVTVTDSRPPVIRLVSDPDHYTLPGRPYEEEGYAAYDDYDGDLTDQVHREEKEGAVLYWVEDSSGNRAEVTREIRYDDPIPPQITLNGGETLYLSAGKPYTDPGCTASDNCDGDLTGAVTVSGEVDGYLSGTYQVTYTVSDAMGNTATVTRDVIIEPSPQAETVTPSGKVIYLTFDDGPSAYTERLLEILDKYNVKATFFVVDSGYVDVIAKIAEGGHSVGIHSVSHDYSAIYSGADAFFEELWQMQEIIFEQTGVTTTLLRFPGGSSNTVSCFNPGVMTRLTKAVEEAGFQYFDWNVDSNDAGGARTAEEVFENVTSGVEGRTISIVLQHDTKGFSVDAVEKIITWGLANGYTFLPLDETSPTAHHGVNN